MKKIALITVLLIITIQAETLKDFMVTQDSNKTLTVEDINNSTTAKLYYQGEVMTVEHGGAYTYIEVKEQTQKTFWIAVTNSDVKIGDFVRFQKELVMRDFKSKALKRTFDELMFASGLQYRVVKKD
ncbi:MAG: Periplasmic cytochrome c nitrite reductase Nrf subunit J (Fragment) [uncultured Sulfurovum sp.]|uniref:Periplasmic cytochrome c nitrite reductase Nrf subunit J n=1 Tax=uncultured Sulfurovum sp. TaxID=269237 RepID=A0A6S6SPL1_9BACT